MSIDEMIKKISKSTSPYFTAQHLYDLNEEFICKNLLEIEKLCGGSKKLQFEKLGKYYPDSNSIRSRSHRCYLEYESYLFTKVLVAKLHPEKKDETIIDYSFSSRRDHC